MTNQATLDHLPAGRRRVRGKLHSVLEKLDYGHHVLRIYCKNLVDRTYERLSTFLRVEAWYWETAVCRPCL
jgi:hypothetical protein